MPPGASTGQSQPVATTASDKAARGESQWLFLQEVADLSGLSEKTVRRHIKKGTLKAKKGKAANARIQVLITPEILASISKESPTEELEEDAGFENIDFEEVSAEEVTEETASDGVTDFSPNPAEKMQADMEMFKGIINEMMAPLVKRVEEQARTLHEQERVIQDQKTQLRLLPDIQAREESERKAREMAELEKQALVKQIEALKTAQEELKATAEKAAELEKQLTIAKRPWWQKLMGSPQES
ncbi:MAG TPA: hypothetical protein PKW73_03200 [Candidatus Obscuribacter sp.]|nr:hypothetical protein [Candidatus Obscuribacter sp.]HNA72315.1 hypothetical protein [Candidatus Obscuribacter sp.]